MLESLYGLLEEGRSLEIANVDTMIRMIETEDSQLTLPTLEKKGRVRMAQIATRKATIVARTPAQDAYMRAMERAELVFGIGPAGTGKTYLAVAHAATLLERGDINRIILSRPAVEAGERLGFLPGDMKEKVDPYLRPLYDALYDMMRPEHVERCITSGIIEVAPLAFMRGRTLANAVVILDEAQNTTSMQMKMFLTRLGENSKMIVTGDPTQIDLPRGEKSGLVEAVGSARRHRRRPHLALQRQGRRPPRAGRPHRPRLRGRPAPSRMRRDSKHGRGHARPAEHRDFAQHRRLAGGARRARRRGRSRRARAVQGQGHRRR